MRKFLCFALLLVPNFGIAADSFEKMVGPVQVGEVSDTSPTNLPFITWGGEAATFLANGLSDVTTPDSTFGKAGLKFKLVNADDPIQGVKNYLEGKTPYLRATFRMAGLCSELLNKDPRTKPVMIFQLTFSLGDHIVGKADIKTLKDLKGKKIAIQQGGPHVGLLDDSLKAAGLDWSDIKVVWCKDLTATDDSPAAKMRAGEADVACVITPDMIGLCSGLDSVGSGAEGTIKGGHVVNSTSTMSRSIADIYLVRSDYFKANRDKVEAFVVGYLQATEELLKLRDAYNDGVGNSPKYVQTLKFLQKTFGEEVIPTIEEDAHGLVLDANFVRIPGNESFFNESGNLAGFDAKQTSALNLAVKLGYANNRAGFLKPDWDYKKISEKAGVKYVPPVLKQGRIRAEAIDFENLDDNVIVTFEIRFEPDQTTFNTDTYGAEFQKVLENASRFGNAVIVIRGNSDPLLMLSHFFKAAKAKGLITGDPGNYSFNGERLDMTDTAKILNVIQNENLSGQKYKNSKTGRMETIPDPRQTAQVAQNLSHSRAESVKKAIEEFAKSKNLKIDFSQIQPRGVGVSNPVVARPRSREDMAKNRRVEFLITRVSAEAVTDDVFNFDD